MSVLTSFTLVLTSFSFSIEQHFCGSNLVDVSVFSKVESCCKTTVTNDDSLQFAQTPCCSNISFVFDGFDNYHNAASTELLIAPIFVVISPVELPADYVFETTVKVPYANFNPPPLITDIQVRDQVFLI